MKTSSKRTQINWWNKEVKHIQQSTQNQLHIKENWITGEVLEPKDLASQGTSLSNIEPTWLATSQEATDSMAVALAEAGITDNVIAEKLKIIMDEAFTSTPDGQIIPDFKTMLDCIKVYMKMKSNKPDTQINIANIFGGKGWDL